ncbi:MAG: xanthine dehydrogenase [Chloroflexi bacterium]|nr:MAG: xanthine dehydrogenase [Chloroflexota bacterium]
MTPSLHAQLVEEIRAERLVAMATLLTGPGKDAKMLIWPDRHTGTLGDDGLDGEVLRVAAAALASQQSARFTFRQRENEWDIFVDVFPPPPQLVMVGAVHIAIPLVTFAAALGFRTMVVDARRAFATPERFAHADQLLIGWPADTLSTLHLNESTCLVTLTHDEKLDNPALLVALNSPVRYIGALGSKRTHASRVAALKAEGATDAQIARIHAPIGLDLGGRRPEEIAVAIIAQIVQVTNEKEMRR